MSIESPKFKQYVEKRMIAVQHKKIDLSESVQDEKGENEKVKNIKAKANSSSKK